MVRDSGPFGGRNQSRYDRLGRILHSSSYYSCSLSGATFERLCSLDYVPSSSNRSGKDGQRINGMN